jgi:arginyl-tRNA synthetase
MNVLERLRDAFAAALPDGADRASFALAVKPANDPKFGDYQANGCMSLAKSLSRNPRELAAELAGRVDLSPLADSPQVAGPGFLNVRLRDEWLAEALRDLLIDDRLGVSDPPRVETVVIDYSSPNIAKPMHVGHIRSTVIGESLARIFETLGHRTVRDNHLGDWGSQFGMILWGWKAIRDEAVFQRDPVEELARLYRETQSRVQAGDREVEAAARLETAKLHAGDPENRSLWDRFMPYCLRALQGVYDRLGVRFDVSLGESFYDPMLPSVVEELLNRGIASESEGAIVVWITTGKAPLIIRKRDGAFTYATTDLAKIRYFEETYHPDQSLYVVDHRQSEHFANLFEAARRWGFDRCRHEHVAFGTILGTDRRPFKTREGDVIGLESLLDEAVARARTIVDENSPELTETERARVAEIVGLGAIKYADLSQNRTSDYVFDWNKMLAMTGNTGAYMQYAYARVRSIFRKGDVDVAKVRRDRPTIRLSAPSERALAASLVRFPETLAQAALDYKPNIVTDYLFDLANRFSTFFEDCPVLRAATDEEKQSRLALCDLTARTLERGLYTLGIEVVERM